MEGHERNALPSAGAAGPEPELGARPQPPPPPRRLRRRSPQQTYGYPPPPPERRRRSSRRRPPPGYGYQPPPPGYPPPGYGYAAVGLPAAAARADNGQAVAGFVLSLVAIGLLVISSGLSSIVSLGCAIGGMVYSRKGKRKVEAGRDAEAPRPGSGGLRHRRSSSACRCSRPPPDGSLLIAVGDASTTTAASSTTARRLRGSARGRVSRRGLTLFSPVRGEPLRQAISDDRRADAAAARGVAGDGGADALPPRSGLHRGLRAGARAASRRSSRRATRCRSSRAPARGAMESAVANLVRPGEPALVASLRQVRRALGGALRGLRRRDDPLGDRVGPQDRPGRSSTRASPRTRASSSCSRPSRRPRQASSTTSAS